jgi:hypothetical protein
VKNRLFAVIAILVLLIIPLLGCSQSTDSPAQSGIIKDVADLKAKQGQWDALIPQVAALQAARTATGTAFDPAALNAKDTALQTQIDTLTKGLQDVQTQFNNYKLANPGNSGQGYSTNPSNPSVSVGGFSYSISPQMNQIFPNGNNYTFTLTITNNTGIPQFVHPDIRLYSSTSVRLGYFSTTTQTGIITTSGDITITPVNFASGLGLNISPALGTTACGGSCSSNCTMSTNALSISSFAGGSNNSGGVWVAQGGQINFTVNIKLCSPDSFNVWNMQFLPWGTPQ